MANLRKKSPAPPRGRELIQEGIRILESVLPSGWDARRVGTRYGSTGPDIEVEIRSPSGERARITAEAKTSATPLSVTNLISQLKAYARKSDGALLVVPYLGPRTRQVLEDAGVSYVDLTGNLNVSLSRPGLALRDVGGRRNPWRVARVPTSLKGRKAARIVRALCDWTAPQPLQLLGVRAEVSLAYTSRLVRFLEEERLVRRATPPATDVEAGSGERRGPVTQVDWFELIRRWTDDYKVLDGNEVSKWLEPRGTASLLSKLAAFGGRYAVTASASAATVAAAAPVPAALCFTPEPDRLALALDLRRTESGANVFLIRPFDDVVYARSRSIRGVWYAALSQTLGDLLTGPGRAATEAEVLVDWMRANEANWRA